MLKTALVGLELWLMLWYLLKVSDVILVQNGHGIFSRISGAISHEICTILDEKIVGFCIFKLKCTREWDDVSASQLTINSSLQHVEST